MSVYPIERIGTGVSLFQVGNDPYHYRDCWGEAHIKSHAEVIFTHRQTHRVFKAKNPTDAMNKLVDGQPLGYVICHTPLIEI